MTQRFFAELTSDFERLLPPQGFQLSGLEGWKRSEGVITCLAVQKHSSEPKCCVDLGVQLAFLPVVGGGAVAGAKEPMNPTLCEVRKRLTPAPELDDFWWVYDAPGSRENLLQVLEQRGLPFLAQFESFPQYWSNISLPDLRGTSFTTKLPGMTRVRAALLMARLHAFLGNAAQCRVFAEYGLETVPAVATGPKRAFKDLLAEHPVA